MPSPDDPLEQVLASLQERAKELRCLYRVHELTDRTDTPLPDVFRGIVEVLPAGWQYPALCRARITCDGGTYESAPRPETPWVQRAAIVVQGRAVGAVEVFYTEPMPPSDEGPFLKEERKLIDTIAERIAHMLAQRQLEGTLRGWREPSGSDPDREWRVIVDFLRKTDPALLGRLARRLLNYLAWNGISDAQDLLQRLMGPADAERIEGDNLPLPTGPAPDLVGIADRAFAIAADRLDAQELVAWIQRWIREDKAAFLIDAVENQGSSLQEIARALERHQHSDIREEDLSRATRLGLRASLVRRYFTPDADFVRIAKQYVDLDDFHDLIRRIVSPSPGHGRLGGKSSGLFLAAQIVRKSAEYAEVLAGVKTPRTWYITSDGLPAFITFNQLQDLYNRKYLEADQIRREYAHIVRIFKSSRFPPEIVNGVALALDDLGDRPLIVRSSSLLEDRIGAAFAGKYKSLFVANIGTRSQRLSGLLDAIAEVYASALAPDPLEYRAERGLLDVNEEMAIMIQEVVGSRVGSYFLPAFAGVALSLNELRWSPRIRRDDGLLRLVPGLGTRAVDRLGDDYPVLLAPGQPDLRVNVQPDALLRYSPRKADAINIETGAFETIDAVRLLAEHPRAFPAARQLISLYDGAAMRPPVGLEPNWNPENIAITFEGLVSSTPFVPRIRALLTLLRDTLETPVDIEFASDGSDLYLLQCRPQTASPESSPAPIPEDLPRDRVVFTANRYISNGSVPDVTHVVYVDPERYGSIERLDDLRDVGRAVGRLNKLLPKRQFILMGPGRWGSRGDITLGVPVSYSDINHTAALVEIARKRGPYVPDLSFGTHFFQDLVEAGIRYVPLYPDDPDVIFNHAFFRSAPNLLATLVPEFARLADVITVVDVPAGNGGAILRLLLNADLDRAVALLAPPASPGSGRGATVTAPPSTRPRHADEHWRWRLHMAERIAAALDAERFGVVGLYVFGSTKNGTAGPASDIDLIVRVAAADDPIMPLRAWLDGWSACLAEINFLRTGHRADRLLDVHFVTDQDVERRTSYAAKIGAVTDAARPLPIGRR